MRKGILVISLDFELLWGLAGCDEKQIENYKCRVKGAVNALEQIIEMFNKYCIKCTIGFVGGGVF